MAEIITTIVSIIITAISITVTIYYARKVYHLQSELHSIPWENLNSFSKVIAKQIVKSKFSPEVLLTCTYRGALVAFLVEKELGGFYPGIVGFCQWKENNEKILPIEGYFPVETPKWVFYIPEPIYQFKDKKVLLVDDFASSGRSLSGIKENLLNKGFKEENIKIATIAVSQNSVDNKLRPDFYGLLVKTTELYFPWGRAR